MSLESDGGMILTGENLRIRRKTCPSATLSTTNPTWINQGANPGLRGERPATNDLNHGTASTDNYAELCSPEDIAEYIPYALSVFVEFTLQASLVRVHHSVHIQPIRTGICRPSAVFRCNGGYEWWKFDETYDSSSSMALTVLVRTLTTSFRHPVGLLWTSVSPS
jgi:hypothetical protein